MSDETTLLPPCTATWELDDPNEEDAAAGRTHVCHLAAYHAAGYHQCACGASLLVGHYSVENEPDYSRTYDEDETVTIRRGDLRAVLDVATMSMDFGSGFLDNEQVEALRKVAVVLGIPPLAVTPSNFVCQYSGEHQWVKQTEYFYVSEPMSVDGRRVAAEREARYNELMDKLTAAKAAVRADRTNEANMAALEAVKQEATAFRNEIRAERDREFTLKSEMEQRPSGFERCALCGATRPIEPT